MLFVLFVWQLKLKQALHKEGRAIFQMHVQSHKVLVDNLSFIIHVQSRHCSVERH
jgi:hypothetical protein